MNVILAICGLLSGIIIFGSMGILFENSEIERFTNENKRMIKIKKANMKNKDE